MVTAAFAYEHHIVTPDDLSRVNRAFFTMNGFVGIALFVFGVADLDLPGADRLTVGRGGYPASRPHPGAQASQGGARAAGQGGLQCARVGRRSPSR